ncbi:hypothetical protein ACMD2_13042, partial [Ananas comosus]
EEKRGGQGSCAFSSWGGDGGGGKGKDDGLCGAEEMSRVGSRTM